MNVFRGYAPHMAALLLSILLIAGISLVQERMDATIKADKLVDPAFAGEGTPPLIAFTTVAFGSFRGLVADILWLRCTSLQDEGKYYEMVQLASWITKLQPRFTGATAFLAWNMAYNISVTFTNPEDKWRWVQKGIELIRDEALDYNPSDPALYKELGWIYQHKLGNILDDGQIYYKYALAKEMMKPFGGPAPDWEALAAAPASEKDFMIAFPKDSPLWSILAKAGFSTIDQLSDKFRETGSMPESLAKEPDARQYLKTLDSYLRASWLSESFKLYPKTVLEINRKYGELDWRLPEAHAIYWAVLGLEHTADKDSKGCVDCHRMVTQSLHAAFISGKMLMPGGEESLSTQYICVPNLNVVDALRAAYLNAEENSQGITTFKDGMRNFMIDAVVTLYSFGRYSKAQEYYELLAKDNPDNKDFKVDLDLFVNKQWLEDVGEASYKQTHSLIGQLMFRSCYFLAYGDYKATEAHLKIARFAYDRYQKIQAASLKRVGLPPFNKMKDEIIQTCIKIFPPDLSKSLKVQIDAGRDELEKERADSPPKSKKGLE